MNFKSVFNLILMATYLAVAAFMLLIASDNLKRVCGPFLCSQPWLGWLALAIAVIFGILFAAKLIRVFRRRL